MKITKETKVVAEEVEFEAGIYCWKDEESSITSYKIEISLDAEYDDDLFADYIFTVLNNFYDKFGIIVYSDNDIFENLPYQFKQFILGGRKREITEEKFEEEKQEILKRL